MKGNVMNRMSADVVIIGSGPTGAAAAWRLAGGGLDVVCIERGDWFAYDKIRRGRDDAPVDDASSPIRPMIGNAVGGSSIYWSAHVPRFRPEDFRIASL